MRALIVEPGPSFSVMDVYNGWYRALQRAGVNVKGVNLGERLTYHERALAQAGMTDRDKAEAAAGLTAESLLANCYTFAPDLVLIVSGFYVPPFVYDVIRAHGTKLVVLFTESPYEDRNQYHIAARADMAIINDPTNIDTFRQHQRETWYAPHAYDPTFHVRRKPSPDLVCDFGWVGTAYRHRIAFFEAVDWSGIDVAFAGNWTKLEDGSPLDGFVVHDKVVDDDLGRPQGPCFDNNDTVDLYSSCKASANLYRKEAVTDDDIHGWAMGPREVELAAVGTFFLTEPRGENREVLPMVPTFDGPSDFEEKLRWWLSHDAERDKVAAAAHAAVVDRTFDNNVRELLNKL